MMYRDLHKKKPSKNTKSKANAIRRALRNPEQRRVVAYHTGIAEERLCRLISQDFSTNDPFIIQIAEVIGVRLKHRSPSPPKNRRGSSFHSRTQMLRRFLRNASPKPAAASPELSDDLESLRQLARIVDGPRAGRIRAVIHRIVRTRGADKSTPRDLDFLLTQLDTFDIATRSIVIQTTEICFKLWAPALSRKKKPPREHDNWRTNSQANNANWRDTPRNAGIYPAQGQTRKPGGHSK
jgi:hypothetical protein